MHDTCCNAENIHAMNHLKMLAETENDNSYFISERNDSNGKVLECGH